MKIKQVLNKKVNSFEFKYNLFHEKALEKILLLFEIKELFLCFYSVADKTEKLQEHINNNQNYFQNFHMGSEKEQESFVVKIQTSNITKFLSLFNANRFDEIVVWSCYIDWDNFLFALNNFSLPTLRSLKKEPPTFYLDYNHHEGKHIEIICDLSFNDGGKITKSDILKILD